ncbi:DegT/DnrJ/EryC1/StrS family aminotransferase [Lacimicrobium alkaliphilum]|uniref:Aminotransferase DegT n=1 Tax=Lacimicrobium alkaliphilum TaxID=1526571 RepID=A0A0U2PHN4_9ALTE|nr:DegT/DnrJ/EryC1/StrS family aminotransferase [Lacimicrobium alkaliphilum]ALS99053.1 aminotransferase DegT [Lacimicrobium alkaliphilum]
MEFIDLQAQLATMRENIDRRIAKVLDHGQFIMGPEVSELEERLADYVGVEHCISCANGTDALQLSLMALGVGANDIVFTTAFSFFATAEVIPLVGATPYFVDINEETYNICPISLEQAIIACKAAGKGIPRAVIAVDLFGMPANYPELRLICDKYDLHLIEDGAQSFGGSISGKKCGSFGDIATTSFFPAKPLGCYGDGGAIFTNNQDLAEQCRSMRVHGKGDHKYQNIRIGLNSRLDTIQAAILLEKLQQFPTELERRNYISKKYASALRADLVHQKASAGFTSAWALYTVSGISESRQSYLDRLSAQGIPSGIYYPVCLHRQPAMQDALAEPCKKAEAASQKAFSIPMHPYMSDQDIDHVINGLSQ